MNNLAFPVKAFSFSELFTIEGLTRLDTTFLTFLKDTDPLLHERLVQYRQGTSLKLKEISQLIIDCGPVLEEFIADLFDIKEEIERLQASTLKDDPIFAFKKFFVLREARRAFSKTDKLEDFSLLDQWLDKQIEGDALEKEDRELSVARFGQQLLSDPHANAPRIEKLTRWCVAALKQPAGQLAVAGWVSFNLPEHLDYENLVNIKRVSHDVLDRLEGSSQSRHDRDGFKLTDPRMSRREVLAHIHYCVYCHKTEGDFCAKGFPVKKGDLSQGLKVNPQGEILTGCPLDEKISEMHVLKREGYAVAALATIMIDNPMCPITGHRICNDCMKACIYQKQEPVNIPQIETRVLTDVLDLPWGVEIYDLLTRWNPLRSKQYLPQPYNGKKILIMGMGPAGLTLAHYLLMEGFAVVGVDGLKIEPLSESFIKMPIRSYADLKENLDNRIMLGFGGVAEYGITVRWDKNFLKLIYINLLRRPYFQVFGSVRFGGTLLVEDAWQLGFDHLAIAVGAGLPQELRIPNSLVPGMRQANDFLMALQLTGAAKFSSLANLQIRLPAVVIGGGLTAIDTATEIQAYYISQVEKVHQRYEVLINYFGEKKIRSRFDKTSLEILDEFIRHGQAVLKERKKASDENRAPNFVALIRQWGGVTIVYRRTLQQSPAYKRNHEEIRKALEEGIYYAEKLDPKSVEVDADGWAAGLLCHHYFMDESGVWIDTGKEKILPARSIFVATGARPNIAYAYEHKNTFSREGFSYKRFELFNNQLQRVEELMHCKMDNFGPFTSYEKEGHRVTFLGDTHPVFHGSVVKAVASAKRVYPKIIESLQDHQNPDSSSSEIAYSQFRMQMKSLFEATVVSVRRCTADMVECKVRAPIAARNFRAGQFYRLQNYESLSPLLGNTRLQTEALAMMASRQNHDPDILTFMILERGATSRLIATLKPNQPISIMGPTGCASKRPRGRTNTIMIIGSSLAVFHLCALAPNYRELGYRVFFVVIVETENELYYRKQIEATSDAILWLMRSGKKIKPVRSQDRVDHGDVVSALCRYAVESPPIPLNLVDQVHVIGSTDLLSQIQKARGNLLKEHFDPETEFIASVYGPMQCMMKGVCAQCLQWQIDPTTGERTKAVFACSWQNQPIELVDIKNIDERLSQNRTQELLSNLWLDYLFATENIERV